MRGVRFAVEAGSQTLSPQAVKAEAAPLADAIGSGLEICQRWGEGIEVQRSIRAGTAGPGHLFQRLVHKRRVRSRTPPPRLPLLGLDADKYRPDFVQVPP